MQQLIDTLNDPDRRAALISTLENLQKAGPAAAAIPTPPTPATPAVAGQAATKPAVALKPGSLGSQVIVHGARLADTLSSSLALALRGITNLPDLIQWLNGVMQDPALLLKGALSAGRLLCVVLLGLGGELLVWRLTHRFYEGLAVDAGRQERDLPPPPAAAAVAEDEPAEETLATRQRHLIEGWQLLRRLPIILVALTVDLLPPLLFLGIALLLLATPLAGSSASRTIILAVIDAYVIVRIVGACARSVFGAPSARLRLLPVADGSARYLMIWVRRIAVAIVFGFALSQIALLFGMDDDTQEGMLRLVSLLVHVMIIIMILQCRANVADWLGGAKPGFFGILRQRLARVWHIYAVTFVGGAWIVYAAEIRDGYERLIHFMLATILVALVARVVDIVLLGALERLFSMTRLDSSRFSRIEERINRYHRPLRLFVRTAVTTVAAFALFQVWGFDAFDWFTRDAFGARLAGSVLTLILTLGVAVALWEALNIATQVYLDELAHEGAVIRAARLRTIIPLLRNALLIALMILIVLTVLSEIGLNIGPLLAGAGIFGVALGFGSQKLVQDFITGIFLLVENAMQVGDTVTVAGLSGTVEYLSIRTLRLRAGDGSVHLIPFSSVSSVTNANRGIGNAAVIVTVDYEEDTDRVGEILDQVATELRNEKAFASGMLSGLQLWGVDRVDGMTVTLAGQIVCTDAARWGVQREFNRRIKIAFQKKGIRMLPTVAVTGFRHPLDVKLQSSEAAGASGPSPGADRP
ncbi:MAG TPA: mechanosensitive ion channel domain-containing protein [Aliidongia sp.]|nr:mechanosensitive ion channel domain-containing protein [Aliidongia sp.]